MMQASSISAVVLAVALLFIGVPASHGRTMTVTKQGKIGVEYTFSGPSVNGTAQQNALRNVVSKALGLTLANIKEVKQVAMATTFRIDQTLTGFANQTVATTVAANLQSAATISSLNAALAVTGKFANSPLFKVAVAVSVVTVTTP